jgi:cysteine-rich repeat protein
MKRYLLFYLILLLAIFIGRNFSFLNYRQLVPQAQADNLTSSVQVYICGNGVIEGDEVCDDGPKNGNYAFNAKDRNCNTSCNGWAPYCGDHIIQTVYDEQCDDGNNINGDGCSSICLIETPAPTNPPSGGGGGGGGGYIPPETKVTFSGKAYPKSIVTLLKDAQVVATTIADENADFSISLTGISSGSYIFSVYSEDKEGNHSSLLTFPLSVTYGVTTNVKSIFIAPTIDTDKSEVKKGEVVKIFGQAAPNSDITVIINSDEEIYGKTKADNAGAYLYNLDTVEVEKGDHLAKSRATLENDISSLSKTVSFKVGDKTILRTKASRCGKADLNCDGRVNLVDFSIAAYWYKRTLSSEFKTIENERLNGDNKIDLIDFSIMAYYWTG